jgi:hypothetical protein
VSPVTLDSEPFWAQAHCGMADGIHRIAHTPLLVSLLLAACAGPDAPEHDVFVSSNCNGEERTATFHFGDVDFDPHCTGGLLGDNCSSNHAEAIQLDGNLVVLRFWLTGSSEDSMRYELMFDHPEGDVDPEPAPGTHETHPIYCSWYRFDDNPELSEVGKRIGCYYSSNRCWAELTIL